MKTIFTNAKVYVDKEVFADSVVVEDGLITAVGGMSADCAEVAGDVQVIDCGGRTLVPGFNDSHMHLFGLGRSLSQVKLGDVKSVEEMVERCRVHKEEHPELVTKGLYAAGWNQDLFTGEKRMPAIDDLDAISQDIPVCLERTCGHIVVCNHRLVSMLEDRGERLTAEQKDKGIFREDACKIARAAIPDPTPEELTEMVLGAMERCARFGVTSVQSNDAEFVFSDHELVEKALANLYDTGRAPIRYRQQISFRSPDYFSEALSQGVYSPEATNLSPDGKAQDKSGRKWLYNGPLKLFADGSLGACTAHMRKGYADDPENHGLSTISTEEMTEYCRRAKEAGVQVFTHGIGDGAVEKIVDVYEEVFGPENPLRCGIIHCQITDEALCRRISDLNIPTLVQPIFLDYDIMIADDRCGTELASQSYAFNTLYNTGSMSFGTDCPVEDCNPFNGIYCAVTRKRMDGTPEGGWNPHQCMDVCDAVDAYTRESAYIEFADDHKGRIKEGYLADMVLLDRDIFTIPAEEIKDIRPVLTMTGGRIVFDNYR